MDHDDFQIEPIRGLPEIPPEGEFILWQGAPASLALARDALALYWVIGYFALLALWNGLPDALDHGAVAGLSAGLPYLVLGALAAVILMTLALVLARTTVYTITNRRVAMRIGAALTVTLNVPFTKLASADLATRRDGTGIITLDLMDDVQLSYLVCWPHVRPWKILPTQPALRSIPDAQKVAGILSEAARTRVETAAETANTPAPSPVPAE